MTSAEEQRITLAAQRDADALPDLSPEQLAQVAAVIAPILAVPCEQQEDRTERKRGAA